MNHVDILRFLSKGDKTLFDIPSAEQSSFLETLPDPRDDKERSFLQYKCQSFFSSRWKMFLLNICGLVLFLPALVYYIIRRLFIVTIEKKEIITDLNGMSEIIPNEISSRYDIAFVGRNPIGALSFSDIPLVFAILFRFFPDGYFSFKVMAKIAQYSQLIKMYNPTGIIAHLEYSFSSSILSYYCNKKNVKHINVMHGEKLYNIVDAYFRFDECYVWNEHYVKLFTDLKAEPSQFKISLPPSMRIDLDEHKNEASWADYKYYLASFTDTEMKRIVDSLIFVKRQGKTVRYRIHPRYRNLDIILKYVKSDEIEDPNEVSILDSIANCSFVIGTYSTVLNQAYCSGREIVIDDVTFKYQFDRLKDLRYWLIDENCPRLSEMQQYTSFDEKNT